MVNVYAEDPNPVFESARAWLPVDRLVILHGRYEGFADLSDIVPLEGESDVYPSEHAKRNEMLRRAGPPDPERWLLWLDCDERVTYASPLIGEQLRRFPSAVAGIRFIESLPPDPELLPGLVDPRRRFRDTVIDNFTGRLYRHLPGLDYRGRHDNLYQGDTLLTGWRRWPSAAMQQIVPDDQVDLEVMHRWWDQPAERRQAKQAYYTSKTRASETASID